MSELARVRPPAPHAAEFVHANPDFNLEASLEFFADRYSGQEWVLEGGAAVHQLTGGNRPEPHDLDVVCLDPAIQNDFNGFEYFDIKSIDLWMAFKGLAVPTGFWEHVMDTSVPANVAGTAVRLMHPSLIAAGKSFPYAGRPQRAKDIRDIELLDVSLAQLDSAKARMVGAVAL